jgi:hypothetical protein
MKAREEITFDFYCVATQTLPENDDLERSNCQKAGESGHTSCGWNYQMNWPEFFGRFSSREKDYE